MNYANFIVKIISKPEKSFFDENLLVIEISAKFPQIQKKKSNEIIHLSIWTTKNDNLDNYYQINDYIIIEGYISLRESNLNYSNLLKNNYVEISVFKIYPFLLNINQIIKPIK